MIYAQSLNSITPIQVSPKYVSESVPLMIDFKNLLATGDSIKTISSTTASVLQGIDPAPQDILSGNSLISGTQVGQMITGGVAWVKYMVEVVVTTTLGSTLAGQASFVVVQG